MSILSALFGAAGDAGDLGGNPLDNKYFEDGGTIRTVSGVPVGETTALRIAAFFRGVSILANTFGLLPIDVCERLEPRGRKRLPEHPLAILLGDPNPWQTSFEYRRLLLYCLILRGNAFSQIAPRTDDPSRRMLVPLHPDRVTGPKLVDGERVYTYRPKAGGPPQALIAGVDIWPLMGLSSDGLRGLSLLELAAEGIAIARSHEDHEAMFFAHGATIPMILEHPNRLKPATADAMSKNFHAAYGGTRNAHRVPVLWEGMKANQVGMTHHDAQFLESWKFASVSQIARWLGLPPHMLADTEKSTSWGTGIEEQRSEMTTFTMQPWATCFEQSADATFLLERERARIFTRANLNVLLRAKTSERYEVYDKAIRCGILSPNDCRELEDLSPRAGGDDYVAVDRVGGSAPAPKAGTPPGPRPPLEDDAPPAERRPRRVKPAAVAVEAIVAALAQRLPALLDRPREEASRAGALAGAWVRTTLRRESEELLELASRHPEPARWRQAVTSYFGRQAGVYAEVLGIPRDEVAIAVKPRQEAAIAGGAAALEAAAWQAYGPAFLALIVPPPPFGGLPAGPPGNAGGSASV